MLHRRAFFSASAGAALATAGSSVMFSRSFKANAAVNTTQDISGYKALICLFFFGGMDGHDVLIPVDEASYAPYLQARQTMLGAYGGRRDRGNLLPLRPATNRAVGERVMGLPPELAGIHAAFGRGEAAIMANVGTLRRPTTLEQYRAKDFLPPRLFSHNDQQAIWQSGQPEGAQAGWGGQFADEIIRAQANGIPDFTAIAGGNVGPFLSGNFTSPYRVSSGGAPDVNILNTIDRMRNVDDAQLARITAQIRAQNYGADHLIEGDIAAATESGLSANAQFKAARAALPGMATEFPNTGLGRQFRSIVETIAIREALGASRQIFFIGMGGFDTHSNQPGQLSGLLRQIDSNVVAFQSAMRELGTSDQATLFTASDFGRTLAVNGDGSDHGWGSNHLVVGGAVKGGEIYGQVAPAGVDHALDTGRGRIIPTTSVEQYAAPMGRWLGLTEGQIGNALPDLRNFSAPAIEMFR